MDALPLAHRASNTCISSLVKRGARSLLLRMGEVYYDVVDRASSFFFPLRSQGSYGTLPL